VPPLRTVTPNRASTGGGGGGGGGGQAGARKATPGAAAAQKNAQPKRVPFSAVEEGFIREARYAQRPRPPPYALRVRVRVSGLAFRPMPS